MPSMASCHIIPSMLELEICILAGGLSSRMGQDKAALRLGGNTVLDHVQKQAEGVQKPVRIIREDLVPRCGPLGGVYTALQTTKAKAVLFLSCDMPFVQPNWLLQLIHEASEHRVAVFTQIGSKVGFPFVIFKSEKALIRRQIAKNQLSLQALPTLLQGRSLPVTAADREDFLNLNTPKDWSRAKTLLKNQRSPRVPKGRNAIVRISNLHVRRGRTVLLHDLSWEFLPGQHWTILGANGSGKTSLLSALMGYLTPSAGEIELLSQRYGYSDFRALRRQIGFVSSSIRQMMPPNEPAIETIISGKEAMIDLWGAISSQDRLQAKRILTKIEGSHLADRPWAVLSQGERQRILIGRALMAKPKLLILDEPCAGLDPAARERFLSFVQNWGAKPSAPALLFVTHHIEEIMPIFTHVLLLKGGKCLAAGPKDHVLRSGLLSEAFGATARIRKGDGRYRLQIQAAGGYVT